MITEKCGINNNEPSLYVFIMICTQFLIFMLFVSRRTPHKQCLCQFQFPSNYPDGAMLIELKSKVFSDKVLKTMTQLVETELKKMTGRVQVYNMRSFV